MFKPTQMVHTSMETIAIVSFILSAISIFIASGLKLYSVAYDRGYQNGKHCGFTEGLYRKQERRNRQNEFVV